MSHVLKLQNRLINPTIQPASFNSYSLHVIIIVAVFAGIMPNCIFMCTFCTDMPSTSAVTVSINASKFERSFDVEQFNEKEIERNKEIAESGIAVDRIPMFATTRNIIADEMQSTGHNLRRRRMKIRNETEYNISLTSTPFTALQSSPALAQHYQSHGVTHHSFSPCENNGTYVNGKCRCFFPFAGERCADYACEHGLSVGPRYDPESTFFNRKCICDEDWAGDLCNIPIADQCNERGQYIRGRCKCHGYYFGPKCQYVGKCVNGKLIEGLCVCNYGYEGDYCDKIVCHHGYRDKTKDSSTCVCPPRHAGIFCDECLLSGDYILPFPNCTEERIPHRARVSREKTDDRIMARLLIIGITLVFLTLMVAGMFITHWGRQRAAECDVDVAQVGKHCALMEERKELLEQAIFQHAFPRDSVDNFRVDCVGGDMLTVDGSRKIVGSGCYTGLGGTPRRNSRFADPNRLDHDLL